MSIAETITKLIETKQKLAELEKRHERYRKTIEDHMKTNSISTIQHKVGLDSYQVKKMVSSRQSISKSDLPVDIWEKYAKTSTFVVIRVDKEKDKHKNVDKLFTRSRKSV